MRTPRERTAAAAAWPVVPNRQSRAQQAASMTQDPGKERNESRISPQTLSSSEKPDTDLAMPQEPRQSAPDDDQELRLPLGFQAVLLPEQPAVLLCKVSYMSRECPVTAAGLRFRKPDQETTLQCCYRHDISWSTSRPMTELLIDATIAVTVTGCLPAGTDTPLGTSQGANAHEVATAPADLHTPPVNAIKFSTDDLPMISQLMDLKVIQSQQDHEGSHCLYLLEQLMFLDSLTSIEPPAMKRRRMRNQHFWRDSAKLSVRERVYVQSAAVQLALEEGLPVTTCTHLDKEQHTSTWTVCLTAFGCKELLNRRVSPLGMAAVVHAFMCRLLKMAGQ